MTMSRIVRTGSIMLLVAAAFCSHAVAQEEEGRRFRIGFVLGGVNSRDEVRSDSANTLLVEDARREPLDFLRDPRNDSGAVGDLKIQPGIRAAVTGTYLIDDRWSVEASAGYQDARVGDVEVQAQFQGDEPISQNFPFNFRIFRFRAGDLTQVPVDVSVFARFRPRAAVRPYLGAGLGYMFVGFDPSRELNQLSTTIDSANGTSTVLQGPPFGTKSLEPIGDSEPLSGATVHAPDTPYWLLSGGIDWAFKRKWSFFADIRYLKTSREFRLQFSGSDSLGVSVPLGVMTVPGSTAPGSYPYGAVFIQEGLLDAGGLYVRTVSSGGQEVFTPCAIGTPECKFYPVPDGANDPGFYYVQGGSVRYDQMSVQFGVRYAF